MSLGTPFGSLQSLLEILCPNEAGVTVPGHQLVNEVLCLIKQAWPRSLHFGLNQLKALVVKIHLNRKEKLGFQCSLMTGADSK